MLDLFNNKNAFLKLKPKLGFYIVIMILLILLGLLIFIYQEDIYDNYQTKGLVNCTKSCTITTAIPSNLDFEKIALNNKSITYQIIHKELIIDEENYQTFYELTLSTNESLMNNEIVNLNFYYNKQRIITKIKEKMF